MAHVSLVDVESGVPSFVGALLEDLASFFVVLDGADGLVPDDEVGEDAASGSGEEVHGLEGLG